MALESYLAKGGERVSRGGLSKPGYRYQEGPIRGLTIEQATSKFEAIWTKIPEKTKEMYAKRAIESGRNPDVNAHLREESESSRKTQDQNARLIEETERRLKEQELERRLREIEQKQ